MDFQRTKPPAEEDDPLEACGPSTESTTTTPNHHQPNNPPKSRCCLSRHHRHHHNHHNRTTSSSSKLLRTPSPTLSAPSPDAMTVPADLHVTAKEFRQLRLAGKLPPVTKRTLSELDLARIITNINLRMDANFDRDLHFKPDLGGAKGQQKRKEAMDYWEALAVEISIYAYGAALPGGGVDCTFQNRAAVNGQGSFHPRLPAMLQALQDILKTLVSERDHPSILQNLDVPLLMQQVRKGVLDLVALTNWLAALLKTHCAPMRDEWADRMVEQVSMGSRNQDPRQIVAGLQTLFATLEAMKLVCSTY